MSALLDLAARVEAASGADRELDALVAPYAGLRVVNEGHPLGICCYDRNHISIVLPYFTRSLDAAMTLVPEGHGWRLWVPDARQERDDNSPFVTIWGSGRMYAPRDTIVATPALALTAAALRARAAQEQSA